MKVSHVTTQAHAYKHTSCAIRMNKKYSNQNTLKATQDTTTLHS